MKYFTTVACLILFSTAATAQAIPYTHHGPPTPDMPKEFAGAGVFHGNKRVLQIVDGKKYYQPYDWVLPVRPYAGSRLPKGTPWHINTVSRWTDGKEWVNAWQIHGHISTEYSLFYWHQVQPKMTEPPNPE